MENWKLELQLTLENSCFISIAKSLWNQADTKVEIENLFQKPKKLRYVWFHVEDHVLSKVNKIGFLGALRSELELVIILLGDKICGWLEYAVNMLHLDISYAMNTSWTTYGTINKLQVTFPLENIKIGNPHRLEKAAMEIEVERYSYMQMNKDEQQKNALSFINKIYYFHILIDQSYLSTRLDYFEIALILANNKLSENEMKCFVENHLREILSFLLLNYGFQKLFYQMFCNVKEFLTIDSYHDLIYEICLKEFYVESRKSPVVDIRQNFVKSAFLLLWTEIPLEMKIELITRFPFLFDYLLIANDTVIWKLIYNDKSLEFYKDSMHTLLGYSLCRGIYYTKPDVLRQSNDLIDLKNHNIFEIIICYCGDFYSAEQLAFLLGEEIIKVKSQLDSSRICNHFIEKQQWHEIDLYLKWLFETEEEVEIFKSRYKTKDFIYEILLEIWDDLDKVTGFLLWLFKSEENIVKYKTENPRMAEKVIRSDIKYNSRKEMEFLPHFEAFMKYWLLSSEYMSCIKENLLKFMD